MDNQQTLLEEDAVSRLRALAPTSFIVEAPAGAGKTELLTQRVLKLLAGVAEPEEIVAITFTLKAAAEMKNRILESLERAACAEVFPAELAPHQRVTFDLARQALAASAARGWNLLDHPGRLRIMTIDALCASLARQMPFLSRFGAQPRMADDAQAHYREAARRTLDLLAEEGAASVHADVVAAALRHLDNDAGRLGGLLAAMLARRDQWLRHALAQATVAAGNGDYGSDTSAAAQQGLAVLVQRDMQGIAAVFDGRLQGLLMPLARQAAGNLAAAGSDSPIAALLDWDQALAGEPEELPLWRGLCELLLTRDGGFRKQFNKNQGVPPGKPGEASKLALKALVEALPESAAPLLAGLRELPEPCYSAEEWRSVAALAQLLKLAAVQLWAVFNEAGEADFVEVAQRALQALGAEDEPSDLALKLDYRIQHLLVDEFQDTSPLQVQLLQRLTAAWMPGDGRTLFLVGDPMQSIYRFRKADVGLFLNASRGGIGAIPLERLRLCRNNRSCPAVVDWINDAFAGAFPEDDKVIEGAIAYRSFVPTRAALPGAGVFVEPLPVAPELPAAAAERVEARRVLQIIERVRQDDPARTIAVLVRARDHLAPLAAEIRRHCPGLRFQAVEIERLTERQVVQDLLALTHALHHRADRVNWLAILRAPWCGLTLHDLHALAADDHAATIWSLLQSEERVARLSADGQARLRHLRGVLAEALARQGRQSPRRWVEGVWIMLGGPRCLASAAEANDAAAFLDLIAQLDTAGRFTPEQLAARMSELYAAPDALADGTLQFMTIHKAKGLEFDTVILPGMHRKTPGEEHALMLWEEVALQGLEEHLVVAPYSKRKQDSDAATPYDYLRRLNRLRADNEAARVLYVAATRAIRALHLVGVVRPKADGEPNLPGGSFLKLLWPALAGAYEAAGLPAETATAGAAATAGEDAAGDVFVPRLRRLVAPAVPEHLRQTLLAVAEDFRIDAAVRSVLAETADPTDPTDPLAANVGTLVHAYLEMIARDGIEAWSSQRLRASQPAMALWLAQRGHAGAAAKQGAARAEAALQATLASEAGRWVLQPRAGGAAELAVSRLEAEGGGGNVSTHIVDRSFVEDGQRWIIDYKTAWVADEAGALPAHAERYRPQLERYARLFADEGLPQRLAVFYAAHGRLVELADLRPGVSGRILNT